MTVLLRQADVASGNAREAVRWARELADYVNEKCPGLEMTAYYEVYGLSGRIYWIAEGDSVGAIDAEFEKIARDTGYQQRLGASLEQGLFAPGSVQDVLLREA
jgi:hypothetical protein